MRRTCASVIWCGRLSQAIKQLHYMYPLIQHKHVLCVTTKCQNVHWNWTSFYNHGMQVCDGVHYTQPSRDNLIFISRYARRQYVLGTNVRPTNNDIVMVYRVIVATSLSSWEGACVLCDVLLRILTLYVWSASRHQLVVYRATDASCSAAGLLLLLAQRSGTRC